MRLTVLIVEDEDAWQRNYRNSLGQEVEIVPAPSLARARQKLLDHRFVDLIVVDGYLDVRNSLESTLEFVRDIRGMFRGPMIAASSSASTNAQLVAAGCNYQAINGKSEVPEVVRRAMRSL